MAGLVYNIYVSPYIYHKISLYTKKSIIMDKTQMAGLVCTICSEYCNHKKPQYLSNKTSNHHLLFKIVDHLNYDRGEQALKEVGK